jgi:hypothetical protein
MKGGLLPALGLLLAWNGAYVAAVYALRARPLGRVLAVLGAAGAGFCVGLNAIWFRYDRRGWSASPSGYGGQFASFIGGVVFLVLPASLAGAGLGTWVGLRLTRQRSRWVPLAVGAAAIGMASIAAVASL